MIENSKRATYPHIEFLNIRQTSNMECFHWITRRGELDDINDWRMEPRMNDDHHPDPQEEPEMILCD